MNGPHRDAEVVYGRANESVAMAVAYFGSYLFWGTLGVIAGGIFLLA